MIVYWEILKKHDFKQNERIQVKLKGLSPVEYRTQSLN
ncbi:Uncharacterised protein [Avibacterium volantium]|uniref:Integrase catalytic domain-containing protein n=1 Tax=Avibacterium volantium TaxID=762 RepID=A0A3S4HTR4_AVIVO|nr:Uncharacterised protein [Avibacterium volantium]